MYKIEDIKVGMSASYSHTITDEDIKSFAEISGDKNPIHLDETYASKSRYKKRIAHGMFSASFFSKLFGTELPGEGCVYAGQNLRFLRPIYLGDVIFVEVVVKTVDTKAKKVFFSTAVKANNKLAIDGEAEIFIP